MGQYLTIWEVERDKIPVDPKERGTGWRSLMGLVRQDIEGGVITSWGAFPGEERGYSVWVGSEVEVMNAMQRYLPLIRFEVHALATEEHVNQMIEGLVG